jgi:hypothetical protein
MLPQLFRNMTRLTLRLDDVEASQWIAYMSFNQAVSNISFTSEFGFQPVSTIE